MPEQTSRAGRFFEHRREWSSRKHEIFLGYSTAFTRIVGRGGGRVYLVDAFAGEGFYGPEKVEGSPILAARIARELAQKGKDLRCINVEALRSVFDNLNANTKPYAEFVDNRFGKFAVHVDAILKDIGSASTLFFLDPFGLEGLEWNTLDKIGTRSRSAITELIINLNVPIFDRMVGWKDSHGQPAREAFLRRLDHTVGSSDWESITDESIPQEERYRNIMALYRTKIEKEFGFLTGTYPVRAVENERLKYYLIFATRHPLGLRILNNICYSVEERYLQAGAALDAAKPQQLAFFGWQTPVPTVQELERLNIEQLLDDVLHLGRSAGQIMFGQLQDRLMYEWFGRVAEKHFREVCRRLIQSGQLICTDRGINDKTLLTFHLATVSGSGVPSPPVN